MKRYLMSLLLIMLVLLPVVPIMAEEQETDDAQRLMFISLADQVADAEQVGDQNKLLELYRQITELDSPYNQVGYFQRGTLYYEQKEYLKAIADLRKVFELAPPEYKTSREFRQVYDQLGKAHIMLGQYEEARADLQKILADYPKCVPCMVNTGHTYLLSGERDQASSWYEKASPLLTDADEVRVWLLADLERFMAEERKGEASRKEWNKIVYIYCNKAGKKQTVKLSRIYQNEAEDLADDGKYLAAANAYVRSAKIAGYAGWNIRISPALSLARAAALYAKEGNTAKAETYYDKAFLKAYRDFDAAHAGRGLEVSELAKLFEAAKRPQEAGNLYKMAVAAADKVLTKATFDVTIRLNDLGEFYEGIASYPAAETAYTRALMMATRDTDDKSPLVAKIMNNLVDVFLATGRYAEAESLLKEALEIFENSVPSGNHPWSPEAKGNLIKLYKMTGRYDELEGLYKKELEKDEMELGKEHPDVTPSLFGLASFYASLWRHAEAEPLFKRIVEINKKPFGEEDLRVASSLSLLASFYETTGRYEEAESLFKRVIELKKKVLGEEDPGVSNPMGNLGFVYRRTGRYAEAEQLYKRALEIEKKALGEGHPDIAPTMNNLALVYATTGRYAEAEQLYKRAIELSEKALGEEHPDVAIMINNLARIYKDTGRYAEAEALHKNSLEMKMKVLAEDNPALVINLRDLAELYFATGRYAESGTMFKKALTFFDRGGEPELLHKVQSGFSRLLAKQGKNEEAIYFGRQAVETIQGLRKNLAGLGKEVQRSYLDTKENIYRDLADLLITEGRQDEAQQVLALLKE